MKNVKKHLLYHSWCGLKSRCYTPSNPKYPRYGGRGIKVCDRWLHSFENFAADMGERPKDHSVDRKDNDGDYTPDNCRWATASEQSRNTHRARLMTVDGVEYHVAELAEKLGMPPATLFYRYEQGWPKEKMFSKELQWNPVESQKKAVAALRLLGKNRTHCTRGHALTGDNLGWAGHKKRCRKCVCARSRRSYYGYIHPVEYYLKGYSEP